MMSKEAQRAELHKTIWRIAVDIAALNAEIARIVTRQSELRTPIDAILADLEGVA